MVHKRIFLLVSISLMVLLVVSHKSYSAAGLPDLSIEPIIRTHTERITSTNHTYTIDIGDTDITATSVYETAENMLKPSDQSTVSIQADRSDGSFIRKTLTETAGETNTGTVYVADINNDDEIDIIAGHVWFEGPEWHPHPYNQKRNSSIDTGKTIPYDLDGDSDLDLVTNRRNQQGVAEAYWHENPGPPASGIWEKHRINIDIRYPEIILFEDIDRDEEDEMVLVDDGGTRGIRIFEIPNDPKSSSPWAYTQVSQSLTLHGLGIGDLNGDERLDIVSDFVWFEQNLSGKWIQHDMPKPNADKNLTMQILVYDIDNDGDNDVFLSHAHDYGAFWLESSGGISPSFLLHEILPGQLPSQLHGVSFGDIDNDGDLDIFLGKCRYNHNDPGQSDPLDVFWLELVRSGHDVSWVKHQLATDLVMGFQPQVVDIDGDGDNDLLMRSLGLGGYGVNPLSFHVTIFENNRTNVDIGDINLDGTVDEWDIRLCAKVILGYENDAVIIQRADINEDDQVNVVDMQAIANIFSTDDRK